MPLPDNFEFVHEVFSKISHKYDVMNDLESLGLHRLWKARLVEELAAAQPRRVLDLACGTGDIALALAKALPKAEIIGLDFNEAMLSIAKSRATREVPLGFVVTMQESDATSGQVGVPGRIGNAARAKSTNNLRFMAGNALELPFEDESFDAVSISFGLRNMPDYAQVLTEMHRVLRSGGRMFCLEASYPTNKLVKPPFKLYFKYWLPTLAKFIVNSPKEYSWLNTSTEAFLGKNELALLMQQTGFSEVRYSSYLLGAAALHRGTK